MQRYGYQVPGEPFLNCEACSAIKKIYIYLERTEKEIQEGNREGEPEAPLSASYFLVCVCLYRSEFSWSWDCLLGDGEEKASCDLLHTYGNMSEGNKLSTLFQ